MQQVSKEREEDEERSTSEKLRQVISKYASSVADVTKLKV